MGLANGFGSKLKSFRRDKGLSQLQLAVDAGVSPRHLSFIETGRSKPSREMVLRLAEELRVPLREQNAMLLAAGFAPVFEQSDLAAPELSAVRDAAARVLESHEPFPAIAIDRRRNIVMRNRAAGRLNQSVAPELLGPQSNIYRLLLHPNGLAPRIVGFKEYSRHLLVRLQREAEISGDGELWALLAELEAYPGVASLRNSVPGGGAVALTLRLRDGVGELAFITTIATFGTPFDVTVSELVIESLFPADASTATRLREQTTSEGSA